MTDERKAGKLILDNLAMFNESVELFEQQIQPEVFVEIGKCVGSWANENGWRFVFDWNENSNNCWVAPSSWNLGDEENFKSWFAFWYENTKTESFELANLCGCGQDRMGFWWNDDSVYLGMRKRQWKAFCRDFKQEIPSKLKEMGFEQKEDSFLGWFFPVTLDSAKLAMAYEEEDYAEALQPLVQVLDKLKSSQAIFDEIISLAEIQSA
jgi:hypothetical protein